MGADFVLGMSGVVESGDTLKGGKSEVLKWELVSVDFALLCCRARFPR